MVSFLLLILTEFLIYAVLRQHYNQVSKTVYNISVLFNIILSIWLWILYISYEGFRSFYDSPRHISLQLALIGALCAIFIPRVIIIILHFTGRLFRRRGHLRWLTNTGLGLGAFIFLAVMTGTLNGRYNFKYENITVPLKGLNDDLNGLTIVQISDLHLSGFYRQPEKLETVMKKINEFDPDIIVNTGDFVSYGWREFGRNDTILAITEAKYGKFAVTGNHDVGIYNPEYTEADKVNNELNIASLIRKSGYYLLSDESTFVNIGSSRIRITGTTTHGRHPKIIHGNLDAAIPDSGFSDFNILLTHDPNHWVYEISGKRSDIDLTLSGHTHGMQLGVNTKRFKWSPIKYFYPNWNGLYNDGFQYQYVNRGLGVLAMPFRIWMPPEITIITLIKE